MEPELKNKKIETFADDMAGVLESNEPGLIKTIIQEQTAREENQKNNSPETTKNKIFMFVSILLVIISVSLIAFVILNKDLGIVSVKQRFNPLIFTDSSAVLDVADLSKRRFIEKIRTQVDTSPVDEGEIEALYLQNGNKILGLREFMQNIESTLDIKSKGDFFEDNFMLGFFDKGERDLFVLIKISSFIDVFENMLAWERKIFEEMHDLWGIELNADTSYLLTKDFVPGFAQNQNARILYDKDNNIVLMYVYVDDTSILITNTERTTREVMLRLAGSKVKK